MPELQLKEILEAIATIEHLANKLIDSSLCDIRGIGIDICLVLKKATGAILQVREMLDEEESESRHGGPEKWKCMWLECASGAGLSGSGHCPGEWWNPECPEFEKYEGEYESNTKADLG